MTGPHQPNARAHGQPYYTDDAVTLYHGHAFEVVSQQLDDQSVNCIVTSPPYYGLRDYGEPGQYGLESSPAEYVDNMRALFHELARVLDVDGTLWLNLGDSYYSGRGNPGPNSDDAKQEARRGWTRTLDQPGVDWGTPKNLLGVPWRVAFALQDDGWILRAEIIWSKRNCMPEAVTDRVSRSHEQIFFFSRSRRYWYDADAIREESDPEQEAHNQRYAKEYAVHTARVATTGQPGNQNNAGIHQRPGREGRNARSVWTISAQPFPGAHFAVFPEEIPRRCIQAGCKPGGTVLDPFSGSGTTGMVAGQLGRRYIGIDLSAKYLDLSLRTRLNQTALLDAETADG